MNPTNKLVEFLLIALALAGMFSAVPKDSSSVSNATQTKTSIMLADGTDPMPFCRRCNATQ